MYTNFQLPQLCFQSNRIHLSSCNGSNFFLKRPIPLAKEKSREEVKCKMPLKLNSLDNEECFDSVEEKNGIVNEAIEIEKAGVTQKIITDIPTISDYGKLTACF